MTRFSQVPIRSKLLIFEMLAVTCALLLACSGFIVTDLLHLRSVRVRDLETLAEITGIDCAAALTFGDRDAANELLAAMRVKPSVEAACIYDANGETFARYVANPAHDFVPPARYTERRLASAWNRVEVAEPIVFHGRRIGTIYLSSNLSSLRDQIVSYLKISCAILFSALIAAFVIAFRLQRAISDPIVCLAAVVGHVSQHKDYSIRAPLIPQEDEIGKLIAGFNAMLGEIERRDRDLEKEVAARTAQIQRILNTAGEGIFELDAAGRVMFINPSAALMLGRTPSELVGARLHELIHAGDGHMPIECCLVCSSVLDPSLRIDTDSFSRRDGSAMPVEFTASTIFREDGVREGVVVTFRDITERLAVEKMKSEFVSTVSHELRTPLTSIRGALGLLAAGLLGNIAPKARRMLDIAINNTDRLVRLINDILDLERMDSGRGELHRKLIDANDLMRQAADVMQAMADRSGIALIVEPHHEPVWGDPDRIVQLLTNLLSNALKFSPTGSTVTLSARSSQHEVVFRVADQGRGIPAAKIDMIFERFQQVDASDSRDKGGTGLGLAICRSIAMAHAGRIWVESREGEGSVFQFAIPLPSGRDATREFLAIVAMEQPALVETRATGAGRKPRILVVEDDLDLARVMTTSFESNGIQAAHATTGREAVDCVVATHPDLIVLDLILPEMDGFAVVDWLKKSNTLAHIPLIVYSALELDAAEQERLRLGPTEFLIKSRVSLEEFEQEVVRLLNTMTTETEAEGAA